MTRLIEGTKLFKVRTGCGHIVIRRMREATAGVPYTEEVILEAPNGMPCEACQKLASSQEFGVWRLAATQGAVRLAG